MTNAIAGIGCSTTRRLVAKTVCVNGSGGPSEDFKPDLVVDAALAGVVLLQEPEEK